MKAIYKGTEYYIISVLGELIEIAPTKHGAGSFLAHKDFITTVE